MKVALVQAPVWGTYDPPMALAQLSGCLKEAGHEVFIFDLNIKLYRARTENYKNMWAWEQCSFWYSDKGVEEFFAHNAELIEKYVFEIIKSGAKAVGFSVNAASRLSSLKLAKMIKSLDKEKTVIFGGPLFFEEGFAESVLSEGVVDFVITGEAEFSLVKLAEFVETKKDVNNCPGVSFKEKEKIVNTGAAGLENNLNLLPFLDFHGLPLADYDDDRHIVFMASRGCVQRCAFCSSRSFWQGYRSMDAERIFREIEFHIKRLRKANQDLCHVDFLDLAFNGNVKSLNDFCCLVIKSGLNIFWTANMIIRKEMGQKIIKKMYASGCEHVIFGIESGSQRVLDLMKKRYLVEDADRIIRQMHDAGIKVTANFMFGFPGETEEDFQKTLWFIKRNHRYLDRVYPSRTYCAIEEPSYLSAHPQEFNIKPGTPNHLYWESMDGKNTYPERLRRCEEFCGLASSLGVEVGNGVQTSVEQDRMFNLGNYYEYKKDLDRALECFLRYCELDEKNEAILGKIRYYAGRLQEEEKDFKVNEELKGRLLRLAQAAENPR